MASNPFYKTGTYYVKSGTYVSPSGQGYSQADIPSGSSVSFQSDPNISKTKKKKGGGGSSSAAAEAEAARQREEAAAIQKAEAEKKVAAEQKALEQQKVRQQQLAYVYQKKIGPERMSVQQKTEKKTFLERNIIARTKKGSVSVPGSVAKTGLSFGEYVSKKTGLSKASAKVETKLFGEPIKVQKGVGIRAVSDVITYSAFLGPVSTAAQTQLKLSQPAKVQFLGTKQQVKGGNVVTRADFVATKGGTKKIGTITGVSKITKVPNTNLVKIKSQAVGAFGKGVIKFPQVKGAVTKVEQFGTESIGVGIKKGKLFSSVEVGRLGAPRKTPTGFIGGGIQKNVNRGVTVSQGGTVVQDVGVSKSFGALFKIKSTPYRLIPLSSKKGTTTLMPIQESPLKLSTIKQSGLASTRISAEAASASIEPIYYGTKFSNVRGVVTSADFKSGIKTKDISPVILGKPTPTVSYSSPLVSTVPLVNLSQPQRPRTITKTRSKGGTRLVETPKVIPKIQQIPKELVIPRTPLKTRQISRRPVSNIPFTISPTIKVKSPVTTPLKRISIPSFGRQSYTVSVRRFGKFKPIGVVKSQRAAFNLGKFKTRTTLGATFKVEGANTKYPDLISGYKTKKTKKGLFYIELPKYRLSTPTEKGEIQYFKGLRRR